MTDYTDLIAQGITVWTLSGQYDDWAMTHPTDSDKDEYSGCWVKAEDAAAAIATLTAERDALRVALNEALTIPYWGDAQDDLVRLSALTAPTTGG